MISKKLLKHLEVFKAKYTVVEHKTVYTAYDLAQTLKKKLDTVAKSILIIADRNHFIVVLPGHRRVDLSKLKKSLKAKKIEIAKEAVQKKALQIKNAALTPFGILYKNIPVLMDAAVAKAKKVYVSSGSFEHALEISGKELLKATTASVAAFSEAGKKIKKNVKKAVKKVTKKSKKGGKKKARV